jgi:hypothetical protein
LLDRRTDRESGMDLYKKQFFQNVMEKLLLPAAVLFSRQ